MTEKRRVPSEENAIDFDRLAVEEAENYEPDELDGPAANLDRTLDDANPDEDR
jgi:hypothetical protein